MDKLLTLTVIGLSTAGVFAVAASGLVLTYTTTGIFNFAHGAIGMLGAFAFWQLHVDWGMPTWLAFAMVLLLIAPAFGVALELVVWRPLRGASDATHLVVSVALLAAALGLGQWLWEPTAAYPLDHFWGDSAVRIGSVDVRWHAVFALGAAVVVAIGLRALLYRTRAGITMRATVDDRALTMLNGARPDRAAMLAWAIGCSTAALSGILIAPDRGLQHGILTLLIVNAYAAAVLGRLRSLPLAFLGAVVLGLADAYGNGYIRANDDFLGGLGPYLGGFVSAIPVLLLFVTLLALPHSRIRGRASTRTREHFPRPTWRGSLAGVVLVLAGTGVVATLVSDGDGLRLQKLFAVAIVALSLVPLVGYAGQISLCPMSFAGIGAIVMAHHGGGGGFGGIVLAAVIAAAVGALVALPALRLSGIYLALATGAFAVVLDRWLFLLPAFDVGPVHVELFGQAGIPVPRLHVPGIDPNDPRAELMVVAAVFCLLWMAVVAVRRSWFGERLLAMKDSPAACATLGLDLTVTKLAVFSLSAAIAGVGGALFGGASASVSPDSFAFFQSLPVLLLAVVGGIGSPIGALIGAATLQLIPTLAGTVTWFAKPSSVIPGLIGVSLGRTPNGVAADLGARLEPLRRSVGAWCGLAVALAGSIALYQAGAIGGWPLGVVLFLAPFLVARAAGPRPRAEVSGDDDLAVEWLGFDDVPDAAVLQRLDEALALPAVTR
jgi:branched-chain amino acid transport system permease protein